MHEIPRTMLFLLSLFPTLSYLVNDHIKRMIYDCKEQGNGLH
ncbi:hypothetical protein GLYMA_05G046251v4 [Glycine max]|nr:hypothetical protein GLYMA_05G046251v4 [Glycine max]KAH1132824.1 hypothetical protein GYH30_011581 [Glycine max]